MWSFKVLSLKMACPVTMGVQWTGKTIRRDNSVSWYLSIENTDSGNVKHGSFTGKCDFSAFKERSRDITLELNDWKPDDSGTGSWFAADSFQSKLDPS